MVLGGHNCVVQVLKNQKGASLLATLLYVSRTYVTQGSVKILEGFLEKSLSIASPMMEWAIWKPGMLWLLFR